MAQKRSEIEVASVDKVSLAVWYASDRGAVQKIIALGESSGHHWMSNGIGLLLGRRQVWLRTSFDYPLATSRPERHSHRSSNPIHPRHQTTTTTETSAVVASIPKGTASETKSG
jgi:hypothetical protein